MPKGLPYFLHSCGNVEKIMGPLIENCAPGGRFAIGPGNSIANYVPFDNLEALRY